MRKIFVLICFLAYSAIYSQNEDPILFSIGEDEVRLSEFKYIYEKNNADKATYSSESLNEYLDLYKKFKLKVHHARALGMDTIKSLQTELAGYRKQLASSYLKDKEISARLIDEVYARTMEDREVSHIFVTADSKASAEQLEKAEEKINEIHNKLIQNKGIGFAKMAMTLSEDKVSAKKQGYLGYYTAPLPDGFYEFENAMYTTPKGGFSKPFRSKMGFHILEVSDVRPARGEMEIAHVLIRANQKTDMSKNSRLLIDSIYKSALAGENFEVLAAKYSEDKKTKDRGGYLGFFGINQFERSFEDAAFDLQKDGDITKPIKTTIGYHVIKRISKRDINDEARTKKRIEARINNNDRFTVAEAKLIEDVKKEAKFKENKHLLKKFSQTLDKEFYSYKWKPNKMAESTALFNLGDKEYTLNDFADYAKSNVRARLKFPKEKPYTEAVLEIYDQYIQDEIISYEESNLENKYADFKALMREYREGILLFEITKNEVWDKASQDTVGLLSFYEKNKNKYMWPDMIEVEKVSINAQSQKDLKKATDYVKKKGITKFLSKYGSKKEYSIEQANEKMEASNLKDLMLKKELNAISKMETENNTSHFFVFKSYEVAKVKTLKEARGYVIADYQDHLEKDWVNTLKNMYPIDFNQSTLNSIVK